MRGALPGVPSPVPLAERLPGVLQEDDFMRRLVAAFDDGFAPVLVTLDGLAGYVDPWLAPPDFLGWLAGWVGVELDDAWSLEQSRSAVAGAARVHRRRGTAAGIAEALRLSFSAEVEVTDSGSCTWSRTPAAEVPHAGPPSVHVRIEHPDPDALDLRRVHAVLEAVKPAHVAHEVEIVRLGDPGEE